MISNHVNIITITIPQGLVRRVLPVLVPKFVELHLRLVSFPSTA